MQLRLEGIDALETHYQARVPGGLLWRQPAELGNAASDALLERLGFTDVQRDEHGVVTSTVPEEVPGYVLTRFADKYGRAVAFAFAGSHRGRDGSQVHLDVDGMRESANYQVLETGLATRRSTHCSTSTSGRRWPTPRSPPAPRARACGSTT